MAAIRSRLFRQQLDFIDDPFRFKSLLCPRRSGKSYCDVAYMFLVGLHHPEGEIAFIAITKTHAKKIIWRELKRFDRQLELGCHFNNVELTCTLPNGSVIGLHGAETEHDIEKFRGVPFRLVVIDEAASMPDKLIDYLYEEVLIPTLRDYLGTLVFSGTPGALLAGAFYKATSDESMQIEITREGKKRVQARPYWDRDRYDGCAFEWSFHRWSVADNVAMPEMWQRTLDDKDRLGWTDDDPRWIREGLGRWCADDSGFVFAYSPKRNDWEPHLHVSASSKYGLPEGHEWHFVFGVDLGYDDDFDLEVFAFSDTCRDFYHLDGWNMPGMDVTQSIEAIQRMLRVYPDPMAIVCDSGGGGRQIFQEFLNRGLRVEPAAKTDKRDYIEIFNSDLRSGRCKIRKDSTLSRQMEVAQWDEKKRGVDKRFADHACDAAIYVRRFALHHFVVPRSAEGPREGTHAWYLEKERAERRAIEERRQKERDMGEFGLGRMDFEDSTWGWN